MKLQSRVDFIQTLEEINFKFSEAYWQHDRIFVPKNYARDKSMPRLSLRTIVKAPDKTVYALVLRRHFEDKHLDIVNSTIVKDYTEAAHIVYQLGYELKYEVSRRAKNSIWATQSVCMSTRLTVFLDIMGVSSQSSVTRTTQKKRMPT